MSTTVHRKRRITRDYFYRCGGLSNPKLFRRKRGGVWCYWETC